MKSIYQLSPWYASRIYQLPGELAQMRIPIDARKLIVDSELGGITPLSLAL